MALRRLPGRERIITIGEHGAVLLADEKLISVPSPRVQVVDTTAAGDTFIGYFLASRLGGRSLEQSLETGCRAAALCVSRAGAMQSIPTPGELTSFSP